MKNFIIVGTYRTGSSALADSIRLQPGVACGWEWTQRVYWWKKIKVAERALAGDFSCLMEDDQDHMARVFKPECSWLGFRRLFSSSPKWIIHPRFSPALWIEKLEGHLRWLAGVTDIHVIHIVRHDSLDWLKSVYLSKMTGFYVGKAYPEDIKMRIPIREAVARLRTKEWIDSRLATLAYSNPYIQIIYEDFLINQDSVAASAVRFLGCDPTIMNTTGRQIFKQSKREASYYISNYEELLANLERLGLLRSRVTKH